MILRQRPLRRKSNFPTCTSHPSPVEFSHTRDYTVRWKTMVDYGASVVSPQIDEGSFSTHGSR